jgi:Asp-tRNA(Asn)/Glu-tRNA(Gln) amidotransferase A subunit family amidase
MTGLRIGLLSKYSAQVSNPAITRSLEFIKTRLVEAGAELVEITFPLLEETRIAHLITIGSEMSAGLASHPLNQKLIWMNRIHYSLFQRIGAQDYGSYFISPSLTKMT